MAAVAGLISAGAGIYSAVKSSKGKKAYVPEGLHGADQTYQDTLGRVSGGVNQMGDQISPELAAAFQGLLGVDRSGIVPAGQAAGQMYGNLAGQAQGASSDMLNQGRGLGQAGQQIWQTALDPQNELRNKLQQQTVDASRAGTSARGIGMGGEAAGIENDAVNNFLLNWQNNQLARQATGLNAYGNAANQSGRQYAGGLTAGALGPEYMTQSAMAPYNAGVTAAGAPFQFANMYSGAQAPVNSAYGGILSSIIPYLNQGVGASNANFFQGQVGLNNFTTGMNQLGNTNWGMFSGSGNNGYNNGYSNTSDYGYSGGGSGDNAYYPYGGGP